MASGKRRTFMIAAAFIMLTMLFIKPGQVHAATISSVDVIFSIDALALTPGNTENNVQDKIQKDSILATSTSGVSIDDFNSWLMYMHETYKEPYGIGGGTTIQETRQYFCCVKFNPNSGYEWPTEVKNLSKTVHTPAENLSSFQVRFNGKPVSGVFLKKCYDGGLDVVIPIANDISTGKAALAQEMVLYNGVEQRIPIKSAVLKNGSPIKVGSGMLYYTDEHSLKTTPKNAGKYFAVIEGKGIYKGILKVPFSITKAENPMTAGGRKVKIQESKLQKKKRTIKKAKAFKIIDPKGDVTFKITKVKKAKYKKYFKINAKTGKITVKKNLKKGTYKLKVLVTAAGDENYNPAQKTVTVTVKVK